MRPSQKGVRRCTPSKRKRSFASGHKHASNSSSGTSGRKTKNNDQHLSHKVVRATEKRSLPSWVAETSDEEFWDNGYNSRGYDRQGFSKSGFNKHGFKRSDYGPDGFNTFGFDREGYNREGRNLVGQTRLDYDADGYDAYGMDCYGYDRQGFNRYGYSKKDYDANGMDRHGYTCQGLYYGMQGTALVPLRHARVIKGRSDPEYGADLYESLREYATLAVLNAEIEYRKLINYQDLITDLSLRWTGRTVVHSLDL